MTKLTTLISPLFPLIIRTPATWNLLPPSNSMTSN